MSGTTHGSAGDEIWSSHPRTGDASNVLVVAQSLDDAGREACRGLMANASAKGGDLVYVVLARSHANRLDPHSLADGPAGAVWIVDATPGEGPSDLAEHASVEVESVPSPARLTDIGVALTTYLSELEERGDRAVVCFRSLTALLQYVDVQQAYRFLNALTNQVAAAGAVAHYHIDPSAHDEQAMRVLSSVFDAVTEVDEDGVLTVTRQ